jgi:hypothetical protein
MITYHIDTVFVRTDDVFGKWNQLDVNPIKLLKVMGWDGNDVGFDITEKVSGKVSSGQYLDAITLVNAAMVLSGSRDEQKRLTAVLLEVAKLAYVNYPFNDEYEALYMLYKVAYAIPSDGYIRGPSEFSAN